MKEKGHGSFFHSHDTDSRRLAEAFFTYTPVNKSPAKKPLTTIAVCGVAFFFIFFAVANNYHLILIPRTVAADSKSGLLAGNQLASLAFINTANAPAKVIGSSISLAIPREEKIGVVFNLAKPRNLNTNTLVFAIQNTTAPLAMEVIVKDVYFRSIATNPVRLQVQTSKDASLTTIPIPFAPEQTARIDLSQIKQIKVFFHYDNTSLEAADIPLRVWKKQWLIIKDVLLVEKEAEV